MRLNLGKFLVCNLYKKAVIYSITTLFIIGFWPYSASAEIDLYGILRSDYRLQGISLSDGNASALIGIEYSPNANLYAGVALTENHFVVADFPRNNWPESVTEYSVYLGGHKSINDSVNLSANYIHYEYPTDKRLSTYDYDELQLTLSLMDVFGLTVGASDNFDNRNKKSHFIELTAQQGINDDWVGSVGLGYHDTDAVFNKSYRYWNIGIGRSWHNVAIDFSVIGTDDNAEFLFGKEITETELVLSLHYSFL